MQTLMALSYSYIRLSKYFFLYSMINDLTEFKSVAIGFTKHLAVDRKTDSFVHS